VCGGEGGRRILYKHILRQQLHLPYETSVFQVQTNGISSHEESRFVKYTCLYNLHSCSFTVTKSTRKSDLRQTSLQYEPQIIHHSISCRRQSLTQHGD